MTICPVKRFTPELIRIYEKSMLKRLVYGPFGDLRRLEKKPDTPACLRLLIGGLFRDYEAARLNTLANILDRASALCMLTLYTVKNYDFSPEK